MIGAAVWTTAHANQGWQGYFQQGLAALLALVGLTLFLLNQVNAMIKLATQGMRPTVVNRLASVYDVFALLIAASLIGPKMG